MLSSIYLTSLAHLICLNPQYQLILLFSPSNNPLIIAQTNRIEIISFQNDIINKTSLIFRNLKSLNKISKIINHPTNYFLTIEYILKFIINHHKILYYFMQLLFLL